MNINIVGLIAGISFDIVVICLILKLHQHQNNSWWQYTDDGE
jgi:hypothetical protein